MNLSCKSLKPVKPLEDYSDINKQVSSSIVNVPISIHIDSLKQLLDKEIPEVLYDDSSMTDNDNDQLMVKATRRDAIGFHLENQTIKYSVPLALWIKKGIKITAVEGEGELTLDFETTFNISENWTLETKTSIVEYQWSRKPIIKLGFFEMPIQFIADKILNDTKTRLSTLIDQQLSEKFRLQDVIHKIWEQLKYPVLVSEEYQAWLRISPEQISMSPLETKKDFIKTNINIVAKNEVFVGAQPQISKAIGLPPFCFSKNETEGFELNLNASIPYEEAEKIANEFIVGQEFSSGNRTVKIEKIKLFGKKEKMVIDALISGDFEGNIYLTGLPVYNENKNEIELEDVDFELQTKNFLHKSAAWLFKKGLRKQLENKLKFPLDENISKIKSEIQKQLKEYPIADGITLKGEMEDFKVKSTHLTPESIVVMTNSKGKLELEVKGFQ